MAEEASVIATAVNIKSNKSSSGIHHHIALHISYPLYITHFPLIYMQMGWREAHLDAPLGQHVMVAVSIFCIAIAIAWASLKLYDEPAREWLKKKLFHC